MKILFIFMIGALTALVYRTEIDSLSNNYKFEKLHYIIKDKTTFLIKKIKNSLDNKVVDEELSKNPDSEGPGQKWEKDLSESKFLLEKKGFLWPIFPKKGLSSNFGKRWGRHHNGIDLPAKEGTAIRASKGGRVIYSQYSFAGFGNLIIIQHINGYQTYYAHTKKNFFKKGQRVKRGQIIATVGSTGNVTGPHLHFEVRRRYKPLNPMSYLAKR